MTAEIVIWTLVFFGVDIGALVWLSTIAIRKDKVKARVQEN